LEDKHPISKMHAGDSILSDEDMTLETWIIRGYKKEESQGRGILAFRGEWIWGFLTQNFEGGKLL
jgi:hypothetical protein